MMKALAAGAQEPLNRPLDFIVLPLAIVVEHYSSVLSTMYCAGQYWFRYASQVRELLS